MAGSGLIAIKRRIKSISNTKKITKAMGLVATSKLRKCRELLAASNEYSKSFNKTVEDILYNHAGLNIYKNGNDSKKRLYVVMTSDSGFCGGFNINVLNNASQAIIDKENSLIIVVGQKGTSYFRRFKYNVSKEYVDLADVPLANESHNIADYIIEMYNNNIIGEVFVVYTKFETTIRQEVDVVKILPFDEFDEKENYKNQEYVKFEPEINTLLDSVVPLYIKETIFNFMIHSKSCEQATRMSAMDGATKNANDLLEKLKVQYNRLRQGAITQEISEIVGGAEAQR